MPWSTSTPLLAHLRVADAMHAQVIGCAPDTPLAEAARRMAARRIHCLVVEEPGATQRGGWSVLSDLDLVTATIDGRLAERTVGEVAATEGPRISADEPLLHAARLMAERGVTHLIVVGAATGRPVGVLSSLDLAAVLAAGAA